MLPSFNECVIRRMPPELSTSSHAIQESSGANAITLQRQTADTSVRDVPSSATRASDCTLMVRFPRGKCVKASHPPCVDQWKFQAAASLVASTTTRGRREASGTTTSEPGSTP